MNACSYELGSNGIEPTLTLTVFSQHEESEHSKLTTVFFLLFLIIIRDHISGPIWILLEIFQNLIILG